MIEMLGQYLHVLPIVLLIILVFVLYQNPPQRYRRRDLSMLPPIVELFKAHRRKQP